MSSRLVRKYLRKIVFPPGDKEQNIGKETSASRIDHLTSICEQCVLLIVLAFYFNALLLACFRK